MKNALVGLLAASGAVMFGVVSMAHGGLVVLVFIIGALAAGLTVYLPLDDQKKSEVALTGATDVSVVKKTSL